LISPQAFPPPQQNIRSNENQKGTPPWEKFAVFIALGLLVVNICQMRSTEKAARAAEDANRITNKNLVQVQRPWVAIDGDMFITKPPKISQLTNGQTQIEGEVGLWLKNFGVNPAFHATIWVVPFTHQQFKKGMTEAQFIEQESNNFKVETAASCRMADSLAAPVSIGDTGSGPYFFPGNRGGYREGINETSPHPQTNTWLTIIGCISYRDQFEKTPIHHTRFCFRSESVMTAITVNQPLEPCGENEEAD
jgi:hypothetical protein